MKLGGGLMIRRLVALILVAVALSACEGEQSSKRLEPTRPRCIAPAKPGGGFDLTCKLAQSGLQEVGLLDKPMRITYMPGGVGAVAYNKIAENDRANADTIVAFSTGSLLGLSQGKFGQFSEKDVRWLAVIGIDYGAVAVAKESPYQTLADLIKALQKNPKQVNFGAGGSVGSQDWIQTALLAKAAGIDPHDMAYVPTEGGDEEVAGVLNGQFAVVSGSVSEFAPYLTDGRLRVLAVFAPNRLDGGLNALPTAKEQGFEIEWSMIRGYYMGADVPADRYHWWQQNFEKLLADPKFAQLRAERELIPFAMTGEELAVYVSKETEKLRTLSAEFGLVAGETQPMINPDPILTERTK